jgi:hypothetical protein
LIILGSVVGIKATIRAVPQVHQGRNGKKGITLQVLFNGAIKVAPFFYALRKIAHRHYRLAD